MYIHVCIHMYIYIVCIYVYIYCVYMYIYCVYMCVYMYIYVCIYVCIYIYILSRLDTFSTEVSCFKACLAAVTMCTCLSVSAFERVGACYKFGTFGKQCCGSLQLAWLVIPVQSEAAGWGSGAGKWRRETGGQGESPVGCRQPVGSRGSPHDEGWRADCENRRFARGTAERAATSPRSTLKTKSEELITTKDLRKWDTTFK